ncbi:hypothetical protein KC19_2G023000 [Ceratodon purpureus]|uniref:Uncharacterized protein n=1 Tax=Ceratodon purpureus TaxID=3225 RepID=A0A8T0IRB0_CERPU|nr:hypothetical protein KC19_2G023000 [Ceratodon purpureus]
MGATRGLITQTSCFKILHVLCFVPSASFQYMKSICRQVLNKEKTMKLKDHYSRFWASQTKRIIKGNYGSLHNLSNNLGYLQDAIYSDFRKAVSSGF